jgi:hypothetical protein
LTLHITTLTPGLPSLVFILSGSKTGIERNQIMLSAT